MAIEVLPNNRDVVLELDAEKMVRVINNLLSNAIKYGHEDSVITMEVLRNDGVVTIAVRNAGDPISKEVLEQLFARFYRAEASRSKGGTGLILAIAEYCKIAWRYDNMLNLKMVKQHLCLLARRKPRFTETI